MKRRSQTTSTTPSSPSPSSSSSHPSGNDKGTLEVKRTKGETSGSSGSDGARAAAAGRCKLEEALECQVCLDVAVSPIYSCNDGGHILCSICHGKLTVPKKCPSCSSQGFENPAALERLAQKLEYRMNCAHAEAGCKEKVLSTEFKIHLNTCFFRDIKCTLGCNNFKFNEYVAHRQQKHNIKTLPMPVAGEVRRYTIPIAANPGSHYEYLMTFENKPFLFRMNLTDSICHIWMVMLGDDKEAMQHFVKISLFGKQKLPRNEASCSWTVPVLPFHEDPATEREKAKPVFASIGRKMYVSMTDTVGLNFTFDMKLELITMK